MERLKDIMMRTAQRRQQEQAQEQATTPPEPPSSLRGQQQMPAPSRRSLPEQTAHLNQQRAGGRTPQLPEARGRAGQRATGANEGYGYPYPRAYDQGDHRSDAGQASRRPGRAFGEETYRVARDPKPRQETVDHPDLSRGASETRVARDYYETYPMPRADVQDEWEDDAVGMLYGDWEEEEHRSFASPSRPPAPHSLPAPTVTTQEARYVQRTTQPLNSRAIAGMRQRMSQERERETPRIQQPVRQVVVRQHEQLPPAESEYASMPRPLASRSVCPKCRGAGYLRVDVPFGHPNFGRPVPCECKEAEWREKRRQELFELSELGAFQHKTFKNFNVHFSGIHHSVIEAFEVACAYAQEPNGWLLLVGPNGCGKTHLAAAIANHRFLDGAVVLFSVVPDLLAHLRATFSPSTTEAYDQRFAKMREAELLVLDDLGAHQSSSWASEKLFQLLNYRYNSRFPTVITANPKGFDTIDERIRSRLSDNALVTTVIMSGARDYRPQNPRRDLLR